MTEDRKAKMDALAAQLEAAGLLRILTRRDGSTDYQLADDGVRVARHLAMTDEASQ